MQNFIAKGSLVSLQSSNGSSDIQTASTSFADMADMSLSIQLKANEILRIDFSCDVQSNNGAPAAEFLLYRNSTIIQKGVCGLINTNLYANFCLGIVDNPGAGTYTYKIQWRTNTGGQPINNYCSSLNMHRNLRAIKIIP